MGDPLFNGNDNFFSPKSQFIERKHLTRAKADISHRGTMEFVYFIGWGALYSIEPGKIVRSLCFWFFL